MTYSPLGMIAPHSDLLVKAYPIRNTDSAA